MTKALDWKRGSQTIMSPLFYGHTHIVDDRNGTPGKTETIARTISFH
ncbi:hypothetical protein [Chromobacterium sp. CV08]